MIKNILILLTSLIFISCGGGGGDGNSSDLSDNQPNTTESRNDSAVKITNVYPKSCQNPCFSPDGKSIIYTRFLNGYNKGPSELVKIRTNGSDEQIIVSANDTDNVNVPFGAWIGNKICFASDRGGDADEIWIVDDNGENLKQITTHSADNEVYYIEPVFNPKNSNQIVFEYVKGENDKTAIHRVAFLDVITKEVTLLTDGTYDDRLPSWSNDGTKILFQRNEYGADEGWQIYTADINTNKPATISNLQLISFGEADYTDCSWSYDDKYILSSSNYGGLDIPNIWAFPIDTTLEPIQKSFNQNNEDGAPTQSHDGKKISFESHSGDSEEEPSQIWIIDSSIKAITTDIISTKLADVNISTWMYQIQGLKDNNSIAKLASSNYDMLVLEAGFNFKDQEDIYNTQNMVSTLSQKPDGTKRLLLAYIDIGQAEDYRSYWKDDWVAPTNNSAGSPDFMITIDPDGWSGNYPVAYWDSRWKSIWLDDDGIIAKLVNYGFDGIYLDWIEAYDDEKVAQYAQSKNISAKDEMITFIEELKAKGKSINSKFVVIAQNAQYLLDHNPTKYASIIDGIAVEDTWFYGQADANWNDPKAGDLVAGNRQEDDYSTENRIKQNKKYLELGMPVFTVDYCISQTNASTTYKKSRDNGFIPLVTRVSLSQITQTPPN